MKLNVSVAKESYLMELRRISFSHLSLCKKSMSLLSPALSVS